MSDEAIKDAKHEHSQGEPITMNHALEAAKEDNANRKLNKKVEKIKDYYIKEFCYKRTHGTAEQEQQYRDNYVKIFGHD